MNKELLTLRLLFPRGGSQIIIGRLSIMTDMGQIGQIMQFGQGRLWSLLSVLQQITTPLFKDNLENWDGNEWDHGWVQMISVFTKLLPNPTLFG